MNRKARVIRCEAGDHGRSVRFLSDRIELGESQSRSVETLTRVVTFRDPFYGKVEITRKMLDSMVKNFNERVYGQDIMIDVSHMPSDGSAGTVERLFVEGNKLRAEIAWTPFGVDAVRTRGFRYFSAEYHEDYEDPESGKAYGPTLLGAGLTTRPRVKKLDPVSLKLSFDHNAGETPFLVSPRVERILSEEITAMWKELMEKLRKQLSSKNLRDPLVTQLCEGFENAVKNVTDEEHAKSLYQAFEKTGVQLAEQTKDLPAEQTIKLDFSGLQAQDQGHKGLSEDDVRKLLAADREAAAKADGERKQKRETLVKVFTDAMDAAEGLKQLSDDQRKALDEAAELITPDMTEDQVRRLAEQQIKLGNQMAVSTQLSAMGYDGRQGSPRVSMDESNSIKSLQEEIITHLRGTASFSTGRLHLAEQGKEHPFVQKVLSEFDRIHAGRLAMERKLLAGGETSISDTNLPAGFQRTVIREALSDMRVLSLVQTLTDFGAQATTQIPYETRDSSAVLNSGIVYEGQPIHRASVSQAMDTAYILPMKLAFLISNEVMHFTRASQINWDAYARNVESNSRLMRELVVRRICNELQRAADAYGAVGVSNENLDAQLDGSTSTIKTAQFPIVRPHQERDLQGNAVGSAENPITVRLNGSAINEYDGSGTQSAGTYFRVTNYNLGYIQFVDETGSPVTPSSTANPDDVSYSYATNVEKFDLDNGSTELGLHLNGLLRVFGNRKAVMAQDRLVLPDFMLMSYTLNNTASNANNFEADSKRNGTDTDAMGDLQAVKGVPAFSSNAPGVDMGDERAILGQRGTLTYTVAKPFVTGQPFEAVDGNGFAIGKKQAYGEEYSAIKVPTPIRNRLTSVIAYSASGR